MPTTLFYPYTSLTAVQKECKNSESSNEDWLKECINDASRMVEEYTRRNFRYHDYAAADLTVKTTWIAGKHIFLPWPIITLTQVKVNDDVLPDTDYSWENLNDGKGTAVITRGLVRSWDAEPVPFEVSGCLNEREDGGAAYHRLFGDSDYAPATAAPDPVLYTITLRGTFGYALSGGSTEVMPPGIPVNVKRATTLIAANISGLNRKEQVGLDGEKQNILDTRIPSDALNLLKPYRITVL